MALMKISEAEKVFGNWKKELKQTLGDDWRKDERIRAIEWALDMCDRLYLIQEASKGLK